MADKPPAFQYYPKDLLADTAHLSPFELGGYWRLCSTAWLGVAGCDPCSLPNNDAQLARIAGMSLDEWREVRANVVALFDERPDRLVHKRLEREWKKLMARRKTKSKAGKKGAESRWGKPNADNGMNGSAMPVPMAHDSPSSAFALASASKRSSSHALPNDLPPPANGKRGSESAKPESPWGDDDGWPKVEKAIRHVFPANARDGMIKAAGRIRAGPHRRSIYAMASDIESYRRAGNLDAVLGAKMLTKAINHRGGA